MAGVGKNATFNTSSPKQIKGFSFEGILSLAHEIGHTQQAHDPEFCAKFKEITGSEVKQHLNQATHPLLERNAWKRALDLLRAIEKKSGQKIMPEYSQVSDFMKEMLTSHRAATSKSYQQEQPVK